MKNKKLFAILTLVCFMFTLMPVAAFAGGETVVAKIGDTEYTDLATALKELKTNDILVLQSDITISDAWDCRSNGAKITVPVTIDGNEKTIKLTGNVDDKNWNTVFRFEDTATVKNLTIDVSEATGVQRGISSKLSIAVDNCKFIGNGTTAKRAIIFGEGAGNAISEVTANITDCNFSNWALGVSDNQNGQDAKTVTITGSTFNNASVLVSASETVSFNGNELTGGYVNIKSYGETNELTVNATGNTLDSNYVEDNKIEANTINAQEDFTIEAVAMVGDKYYTDLQEAIKAAAPSGTVEIIDDVEVDKWIMFSESLSIANGNIITLVIDGMTINGNGHTLTVNSIESATNGNRLFYDATNLNINDLTINLPDGGSGIGLKSGVINKVNFVGGVYGVLPGDGDITIQNSSFKTNGTAIYYEEERDNLTVTGNTFEQGANVNVILLRGDTTFTNNTIISGRTVNVVSGSPVVTGNDFNDVRLKVYNVATGTIEDNIINTLEFNDETTVNSTFSGNTLSDEAKGLLISANVEFKFKVTYTDGVGETIFDDQTTSVTNGSATPAFAGTPERDGYTFVGWSPAVAATVTDNVTYTAMWRAISYGGGGFTGSYNYPANVDVSEGCDVELSDDYATEGETVTITVTPDAGKQVESVIVTDKDGEVIPVTKVGENKYEFTMPEGEVNIVVLTEEVSYENTIVLQIGNYNVVADGTAFPSDVAPFIIDGHTYVPIRVIVEAMGGEVDWDDATRTVTIVIDGKVLSMTIDQIMAGYDCAAIIVDGRTYVPIRYVSEAVGFDVDWIADTRQVIVRK